MLSQKKLTETFKEHYVHRLDLGNDPFDRGFVSTFFYQGADRRKYLEQLVHFARFSKQPVLFCGEAGVGKKVLIAKMIEQLQPVMDCCRLNVEDLSDQEAILKALAEKLGLKLDANQTVDSFVKALKFTLQLDDECEPALVVIEKIHLLDKAEINFLMSLHEAAQGAIHLLFVSEGEGKLLIGERFKNHQTVKLIELRPLSQQETAEYLVLLMQEVGYAGEMPISQTQLQYLHEYSKGNLAAIISAMPDLLMSVNEGDEKTNSFAIPITHVVAISILVTAIIFSYFYQGDDSLENKDKDVNSSSLDKNLKISEKENIDIVVKSEAAPPLTIKTEASAIVVAEPKPAVGNLQQKIAPITDTLIISTDDSGSSKSDGAPEKSADTAPSTIPVRLTYTAKEQRLLNMPTSSFMLQLLGTRKEQSAIDFAQQYRNQLPTTYFKTTLKELPWFVVLAGPYENRTKALAAIKHLPSKLQHQKPWARGLAGIKAEIKASTESSF